MELKFDPKLIDVLRLAENRYGNSFQTLIFLAVRAGNYKLAGYLLNYANK